MGTDDIHDDSHGSLRDKLPPVEPPPELGARVRQSMLERGFLPTPARDWGTWPRLVGIVAVAASFLFAGFFLGRNFGSDSATPNARRYALLLYRGESQPGAQSVDRRKEYGEWLRRVASNDRSFTGEELEPALVTLGSPVSAGSLVGFFIVSARSDDAARSIAQTSPHLRHGGSIVLQRIVE